MHCAFLVAFVVLLAGTEARSAGRHRHPHCFRAEEVQNGEVPPMLRSRSARWARQAALQAVASLESEAAGGRRQRRHREASSCPNLKVQDLVNKDVSERSISPWKYSINQDDNRYPPKLAVAECLCQGCIDALTGQESSSLNSVPVYQSTMVLRRRPCQRDDEEGTPGFSFEVEHVEIPVACACALPRVSG